MSFDKTPSKPQRRVPDKAIETPPPHHHQGIPHEILPAKDPAAQGEPASSSDHGAHHPQAGDEGEAMKHVPESMQQDSISKEDRDPYAYSNGYDFGPIPPPKMADEELFSGLIMDRLEGVHNGSQAYMTYDAQYWLGWTYDRALIRAEGDIVDGAFQNARSELLWAHAADPNWDLHLGVRYDTGLGPDRQWLAVGVQGFAPFWIYVEATAYVGEQGRTAFRIETEYDVLLTQKLVLQPRIEANFYGKKDEARALGHGLSDLAVGLRLHYEIWRELAPYIGVEWSGKFGDTGHYLQNAGNRVDETRAIAGLQFWF